MPFVRDRQSERRMPPRRARSEPDSAAKRLYRRARSTLSHCKANCASVASWIKAKTNLWYASAVALCIVALAAPPSWWNHALSASGHSSATKLALRLAFGIVGVPVLCYVAVRFVHVAINQLIDLAVETVSAIEAVFRLSTALFRLSIVAALLFSAGLSSLLCLIVARKLVLG